MKLSRRTLARSAGASLIMAPFYNLLAPRKARAQAASGCRRIFIFHSQPCNTKEWNPSNVMGENTFTLPAMLANLNEIKQHIVLVDGLAPKQPGDNHFSPHALTGVGREGRTGGQISIEQYIADQLEKTPEKRPIKSLLLGTGAGSEAVFYRNNARLTTIASPLSGYNTVFSNVSTGPGTAPSDLLLRRKSILDVVKGDVGELNALLGGSEKQKLELHLDSIRAFENRISDTISKGSAGCAKPAAPNDDRSTTAKKTLADMANLELVINAFSCDITRLGAVQWGNSHTWQFDTPTGLRGELHMGIIHVQKIPAGIAIENWLASQFVSVVKKLQSIPEPDGSGTLFDNTLVVWTRDFGDADAHNSRNMKFILAQGNGGYLKTNPNGRYIRITAGNRQERILLNLAEAMGVRDWSGFGDMGADFKPMKNPLPELRA